MALGIGNFLTTGVGGGELVDLEGGEENFDPSRGEAKNISTRLEGGGECHPFIDKASALL